MTPLLEGKNAIIYGGGGNIGTGVARTFAREGVAAFIASDRGSGITASIVNVNSGISAR
jgi:NAD(P)-dependent dehydrogenase (short-subunit alcohol dehydrogenase family)